MTLIGLTSTRKGEMSLKILCFCPYYPPHIGGLENYSRELYLRLVARGHSVIVLTARQPKETTVVETMTRGQGSGRVTRLSSFEVLPGYPLFSPFNRLFWAQIYGVMKQPPDIFFSCTRFFTSSLLALFLAKVTGRPLLHLEHGTSAVRSCNAIVNWLAYWYDQTCGRLIFRSSAINISTSRATQQFIARFDHRFSPLLYRGMSYHQLEQIAADSYVKALSQRRVVIIYAGRFVPAKGLKQLIAASQALPAKSFYLVLIGRGPYQAALAKMEHDLPETVQLLGAKSHREALAMIKAADIVVNPSLSEGLPTNVLEAAALGRAVVATDVGGTREIIKDKVSGLLCQAGDSTSLRERLEELIRQPDLRRSLGNAAARDVRVRFNWAKTAQRYEAIMRQISEQNK